MTCVHLQKLYQLCQDNQLRLSSSDLIHVVCSQCELDEVCPSLLVDEYQAKHEREQASDETQAKKP